jgi:hypothetical protein
MFFRKKGFLVMISFRDKITSYRIRTSVMCVTLLTLLFTLASSSFASGGKSCASFTVTLSDGRSFNGNQNVSVSVAAGATAQVRGQFVSYTVALNTFTVTNYTLTSNITGNLPEVIFAREQPLHGKTLSSNLSINLNGEQATLARSGGGVSMKIQSKDCSEGGLFEMEPEPAVEVEHQLGADFAYCVDASGRVMIVSATNPFIGRESPEMATLSFPSPLSAVVGTRITRWQIQSGGHMELETGEDAVQPLSAACSSSTTTTPTPTPTASPTPTATPTPGVGVNVEIRLIGASINGVVPEGEAEVERESEGTHFKVSVNHVNLPDGTTLNVLVDGVKIGTITLSQQRGEIRLRADRGQPVPPIVNGTTVAVTDAAGATLLGGTFNSSLPNPNGTPTPTPTPTPPGADVRTRILLAGALINGMLPQGHADFRTRANGNRSLEVEAEDVNLPAGTVLTVLVNGVSIGQIILNPAFEGEIELESEHGQIVPTIAQGTTITVVNAATGATILAGSFGTIANAANPLDDANFFVRQQYIDFLGRAPEQEGFDAWVGVLNSCPNNGYGREHPDCDRVQISSGFYRSQEFSGRGYFIYRLYDAALGRLPHYNEFMNDLARLGVLQSASTLDAAKVQLARELMQRPEFAAIFGNVEDSAHAEDFVSRLERAAGVTVASHAQLVADRRNGARSAEDTLRAFVETPEVDAHFHNRGFVAMQYFGYLRREPEMDGFNTWVNVITNGAPASGGNPAIEPGDFRPMIFGFVHSQEYRNRFGQP